MTEFTDQLGTIVAVPAPPRRIISVVPSQTELLYDLGLEHEVVGITKFCVHPKKWFREKVRVGGTKNLHLDAIRGLKPDLIIANKEENEKGQLHELMREFPVWVSDIGDLTDAMDMIGSIGQLTGKNKKAGDLNGEIKRRFQALHSSPLTSLRKPQTAYFIWRDPWMVAAGDTFIDDMMEHCGLRNCFGHLSRYPVIDLKDLREEKCELVLLSSEPFPFREKHAAEIRELFPEMKILLVDGEMFSWYGSRLLKAPAYFGEVMVKVGMK
jgi:ABC-type Fe3+-hydroxamate transport system substrate-binding protein